MHISFPSKVSEGFAIYSVINITFNIIHASKNDYGRKGPSTIKKNIEALSSTKLWWIIHSQLVDQLRNIYFTTGNGETEYIQECSLHKRVGTVGTTNQNRVNDKTWACYIQLTYTVRSMCILQYYLSD